MRAYITCLENRFDDALMLCNKADRENKVFQLAVFNSPGFGIESSNERLKVKMNLSSKGDMYLHQELVSKRKVRRAAKYRVKLCKAYMHGK